MPGIAIAFALIAALALPAAARAGTQGGAPQGKMSGLVGCVDFNRALNEVSDGKRAKQRLESEFREKQQQLGRLQSELKTAGDAIERDRLLLSPDALKDREEQYRGGYSELNQRLETFKREISAKETELTHEILNRLRSIVRDIGREEGYTLILEKSQDVVLYAPEGGDLTDRVIQAYDRGRGKKK